MLLFICLCISIVLIGYLFGSLNSSIIVGRLYKIDIRQHGSGNAGMSNTLRTLGKLPAVYVILGDVLKGVISCLLGSVILSTLTSTPQLGLLLGGLGSVLGHNWPIYFNFKGGKGILTTFSVILTVDYRIGLILFLIFLIIVIFTRFISLGSMIAAACFPIVAYVGMEYFNTNILFVVLATILACVAIYRHSANIKRLIAGTENKLSFKKKTLNNP